MDGRQQNFRWMLVAGVVLLGVGASNGAPTFTVEDRSFEAQPQQSGQSDFDFEIGTWRTQLSRLQKPLTGSKSWVEYTGTSVVRRVLDGKANLVELDVAGPAGRILGLSLRLYNPEARQWSLNYSNMATGTLSPAVTGEFKNGRGMFYGTDTLYGRPILVRFVITPMTPESIRFEQAFSDDGGATWEANWVAIDTRTKG